MPHQGVIEVSEQGNAMIRLTASEEDDLRKSRGRRQGDQIRNYSKGAGKIQRTDLQEQSNAELGRWKQCVGGKQYSI